MTNARGNVLTSYAARLGEVMPRGPQGQKRPADVIGNAVKVMRIATGQEEEEFEVEPGKNAAAVELGRAGGRARAESLSKKRRSEIATKAATKRWAGQTLPEE